MVLTFALTPVAAEFSGTWKGTLEIVTPGGRTQADRCYMELRQSGMRITGVIGPDQSVQWSIQNGRVEGGRITFAVFPPEGGRLMFDLRLTGSRLVGEARGENLGLTFEAKVNLTRMTD